MNQSKDDIGADLVYADSLTRQWPKLPLLKFLGFTNAARIRVCRVQWVKKNTVSLSEVFELVISSDTYPRPGYVTSKMLDIPCVGIETFRVVVRSMSSLDFGEKCNWAWKTKREQLEKGTRVKGNRGWSFPIERKKAI